MYRVILDPKAMTSVDIEGDRYTEDHSGGLRIFKGDKMVALFRDYVGIYPK